MPNLTRAGVFKAKIELWECMKSIEEKVKSKGISKTQNVNEIAKECFDQLTEQLNCNTELNSVCVMVALSGVEVFFAPAFVIAQELEKYQQDPSPHVQLVWRKLCDV